MAIVQITPIVVKRSDTREATQLEVNTVSDNLMDTGNIYWALETSTDVIDNGNMSLTGQDYIDCIGDSAKLVQYVADKLGVTITSGLSGKGKNKN